MNYKKIHDSIIERALRENRVYNSKIHHKHHIIPLHEDKSSKELVVLTHKEHRIVHLLRSKFCSKEKNYIAYKLLSNDQDVSISSLAGKIGGKISKNKKLGIFSEQHDRSFETKRRYELGLMSIPWFKLDKNNASRGGKACVFSEKGIYSKEWNRSESSSRAWKEQDPSKKNKRIKKLQENAKTAGQISLQKQVGIHSLSEDERRENSSRGGKSHLGKRWMNNGVEVKRVPEKLVDFYIADGWKIGTKRKEYSK
jgi:hypothetical protein